MNLKPSLVFLTLSFLSMTAQSAGLSPSDDQDSVDNELNYLSRTGNYLGAISLLKHEIAKGETEKNKWTQTLAFYHSLVGQYSEAIVAMHAAWTVPSPTSMPQPIRDQFLNAVNIQAARSAICDEIKNHQIVIINENHHHPQHRTFGKTLLPCFKSAGFKYFALETIGESTEKINSRKTVSRLDTGYYVAEPQMAALVEEGLNLGFKIVRYEAQMNCQNCTGEDSIDQREEGQANNLISEIFSKDKTAKVVIWVGYAHAYKRQLSSSPKSRWMATRLWQKTGIEPFSIEQLSEQFEWDATQPAFEAINTKMDSSRPGYVDLRSSWDKIPKEYQDSLRKTDYDSLPAIDAIVVHPQRHSNDSRALWLERDQNEVSKITLTKLPRDKDYLVQVFPPNADRSSLDDRVPLDQAVCKVNVPCIVAVRPARYLVRVRREDGSVALLYKETIVAEGQKL